MGIDLRPDATSGELQSLAGKARAGDKLAQLELGIAFEEGRSVAHDCKRARKLYRLAAAATGGTTFVYLPPAHKGGRGTMVPINTGPRVAGLDEAKHRLRRLDISSNRCTNDTEPDANSNQY